jgi:hypothetical protein
MMAHAKILVIRLSALGDVLFTLPAVHAELAHPGAEIDWLVEGAPPRCSTSTRGAAGRRLGRSPSRATDAVRCAGRRRPGVGAPWRCAASATISC